MNTAFKKSTSVLSALALTAALHLCSFLSLWGAMPACHAAEGVKTEGCCSHEAAPQTPVPAQEDGKCCLSAADTQSVQRFVQAPQAEVFHFTGPSALTACEVYSPRTLAGASPPGSFFVTNVLLKTCSAHSPPVF